MLSCLDAHFLRGTEFGGKGILVGAYLEVRNASLKRMWEEKWKICLGAQLFQPLLRDLFSLIDQMGYIKEFRGTSLVFYLAF